MRCRARSRPARAPQALAVRTQSRSSSCRAYVEPYREISSLARRMSLADSRTDRMIVSPEAPSRTAAAEYTCQVERPSYEQLDDPCALELRVADRTHVPAVRQRAVRRAGLTARYQRTAGCRPTPQGRVSRRRFAGTLDLHGRALHGPDHGRRAGHPHAVGPPQGAPPRLRQAHAPVGRGRRPRGRRHAGRLRRAAGRRRGRGPAGRRRARRADRGRGHRRRGARRPRRASSAGPAWWSSRATTRS